MSIVLIILIGLAVIVGLLVLYGLKAGLFKGIKIFSKQLIDGALYAKKFEGNYKDVGKVFQEMKDLRKKFKKEKQYYLCGIYYDNPSLPKTDPNHCKALIGIFKKKLGSSFKVDEELESYAINDAHLKKYMIPKVNSLYCLWEYSSPMAMATGIKKYFAKLFSELKKDSYCSAMKIDRNKLSCAIEFYEGGKKIEFFTPIERTEEFTNFIDNEFIPTAK